MALWANTGQESRDQWELLGALSSMGETDGNENWHGVSAKTSVRDCQGTLCLYSGKIFAFNQDADLDLHHYWIQLVEIATCWNTITQPESSLP